MIGESGKILSKKEKRKLRRMERQMLNQKEQTKRTVKKFLTYFSVCALIILFFFLIFRSNSNQQPAESIIAIEAADQVKGNKDAKVILVEYSDFQCPACASFYPIVKKMSQEFSEKIAFVYRHFPLTQHKNAKPAAYAAEAAGKQGKFWEMHDIIFENQNNWSQEKNAKDLFIKYAQDLGLDIEKFKSDFDSKEISDKIENDYKGGLALKVNGTPSFFLNGKYLDIRSGIISTEEKFRQLLQSEVDKTAPGEAPQNASGDNKQSK